MKNLLQKVQSKIDSLSTDLFTEMDIFNKLEIRQSIVLHSLAKIKVEEIIENLYNDELIDNSDILSHLFLELNTSYTTTRDKLLQMVENHELINDSIVEQYDVNIIIQDFINE